MAQTLDPSAEDNWAAQSRPGKTHVPSRHVRADATVARRATETVVDHGGETVFHWLDPRFPVERSNLLEFIACDDDFRATPRPTHLRKAHRGVAWVRGWMPGRWSAWISVPIVP